MKATTGIWILIQIILIVLYAVFSSAEISILSANKRKSETEEEEKDRKWERLNRLKEAPEKFITRMRTAVMFCGFLNSAFVSERFADPLTEQLLKNEAVRAHCSYGAVHTVAVIIVILILVCVTMIFGEIVPQRAAAKESVKMARTLSGIAAAVSALFAPLAGFLNGISKGILKMANVDVSEEHGAVSEEEIRMLVDAGSEKGAIDYEEKEFIQNVFEFDDLDAEEIATHRTDVDMLWMEDDDQTWKETIHDTRHTLYPICEESPDHIVGILNAKDYFRLDDKTRENIVAHAVKPAYFVPETIKADQLFRNMRSKGYTMAVVLDEYGGMVGIVTLNDLIEQIVGKLEANVPEIREDEPKIRRINDTTWSVTGNATLDDLEDAIGVSFENEEYDTFTGLIFDALGMVPEDGPQNIDLQLPGLMIHISLIEEHQVEQATIHICE